MSNTVLIVEDNEKNCTLIRDILEYHGFDVKTAGDGRTGITLAKECRPAVMLVDIQMPVMDGVSVAKQLKGDPETRHIRLIALTSFAMKGDRERFLEVGFDDYLAKPIDTRKLPEIVKKYTAAE